MSKHKRFHLKDLASLREELEELGLDLPIEEDFSILRDAVAVGRRHTPNRFAVQPMEGFDSAPDGSPGELGFRRYRRYAEGGSGLIWFEATAVLHDARSNPKQAYFHKGNVDAYARLVEATRKSAKEVFGHELVLVIQLTHSGRYCKPSGMPRPIIAHHNPVLDPRHNLPDDYPLVTDEYLDRLQDTYVEAAKLAARAGFDGVDVKSCHRYLVSELLASPTREGRYGGSLENRSRLLRETLARIREEAPDIFVTTRMNVYDALPYPYGFGVDRENHEVPDLAEPIELIRQLQKIGIPVINVSVGNPYYNPHYGRPFDRPVVGVDAPDEHPLYGVVRFANITRTIQQTFPDLPVIASGYTWLRHLMPYAAAGIVKRKWATLVGQGRGAFAYPDSVNDVFSAGAMDPAKTCITCSGCTQIMRDGTMTGCVVRDREIYGLQYKLGRRFGLDRLRRQAERCQDCEFPTCTANCPAHVDVPAFIRAFAEGNVGEAYDVLRRSNVLPEMCAYVCPSDVQCEGGCIEKIFSDCALPIRDIQLVVSREARLEGLVGVRLPEAASGRNVAVVGGGPAGLACAIRLLELGHAVTLFEKSSRLGGTPECVIPNARYRGAAEEIDAIFEPARKAGRIDVRLDHALGRDVSLDSLQAQHDAVFLGVGLAKSTSLGQAQGVVDALTFLKRAKQGKTTSAGDRVAVLGGGNTAMDAAVTARQLGSRDVYLVYRRSFHEMPAWPEDRDRALEEGCHLMILTQPLAYETDDSGRLTGLRVARTELGDPDDSGRRSPVVVPASESVMSVDLVIEAMGQAIPSKLREVLNDVALTKHGLVATPPDSQATSLPGVFAGGDLVNGGTTAVQGISEGMRAAEEIDRLLRPPGTEPSSAGPS
ncbi:MAG: FAD-dependent oxidoreductase [Planctomycetota bacterium]|jgi:NADPH-dependent glutamate synthase beta subunit-like oxidoreductase/2,4-dienoyl-CoA reductase-like NADH-dependent reductase (Old Yellow Enzyme family)